MNITDSHQANADSYAGDMPKERRAAVMQHIRETPAVRRQALINQLASAPGETRKFILHVFGPGVGAQDAPANKSVTPPTTK